jgi:hypothetical protein
MEGRAECGRSERAGTQQRRRERPRSTAGGPLRALPAPMLLRVRACRCGARIAQLPPPAQSRRPRSECERRVARRAPAKRAVMVQKVRARPAQGPTARAARAQARARVRASAPPPERPARREGVRAVRGPPPHRHPRSAPGGESRGGSPRQLAQAPPPLRGTARTRGARCATAGRPQLHAAGRPHLHGEREGTRAKTEASPSHGIPWWGKGYPDAPRAGMRQTRPS